MTSTVDRVIAGYEADAATLISRYDGVSPDALYAHVRAFIPQTPARIIDIGAGTGRDARLFTELGHNVTAVEPVTAFARAGARHSDPSIVWINDRLPELLDVRASGARFDLINVNAVWHHLPGDLRAAAMTSLADIAGPGATLILSLRDGPTAPDRPGFPIDADETLNQAHEVGFDLAFHDKRPAKQPANVRLGVEWTWLVFRFNRERPQ